VANEEVQKAEIEAIDQIAKMAPSVNLILFSGVALVLIYGARLVNDGLIQTGNGYGFLSYFIQITNSLMAMNRMVNIYNRAVASEKRIAEVLELPADTNQIAAADQIQQLPDPDPEVPEVEFRNVSFSYLGKRNDLDQISLSTVPGRNTRNYGGHRLRQKYCYQAFAAAI